MGHFRPGNAIQLEIDPNEELYPIKLTAECCEGEHEVGLWMDARSAALLAKQLVIKAEEAAEIEDRALPFIPPRRYGFWWKSI